MVVFKLCVLTFVFPSLKYYGFLSLKTKFTFCFYAVRFAVSFDFGPRLDIEFEDVPFNSIFAVDSENNSVYVVAFRFDTSRCVWVFLVQNRFSFSIYFCFWRLRLDDQNSQKCSQVPVYWCCLDLLAHSFLLFQTSLRTVSFVDTERQSFFRLWI